jgi:NAD(P)-dependent dehydrogenase (short-subunit alcohol dehydrogenase family)
VGSIDDNRLGGWYAYRASKAALNMILKNASIEIARKNKHAIVAGLHPGTVDSALSKPFQGNVPDGKLFTPDDSAAKLLSVLDSLTPADSGHVFDFNGIRVPA